MPGLFWFPVYDVFGQYIPESESTNGSSPWLTFALKMQVCSSAAPSLLILVL